MRKKNSEIAINKKVAPKYSLEGKADAHQSKILTKYFSVVKNASFLKTQN